MTLASAAVIYGGLHLVLARLAQSAESGGAYPYEAGEDPIRLMLPALFHHARADIMLTGSSNAAEAFVLPDFEAACRGSQILAMSFSTATLDDILVVLDYIEKVYGPGMMPRILVVGIYPRLIANIPRRFGPDRDPIPYAALFQAINRYSPYYRVEPTRTGSRLVKKNAAEALRSAFRFQLKQQPRYRMGIMAALRRLLSLGGGEGTLRASLPTMRNTRRFGGAELIPTLTHIRRIGAWPLLLAWIRAYPSPHLAQYAPRLSEDEIEAIVGGLWVFPPEHATPLARQHLQELIGRCRRLGIRPYLVNLPEHPALLERYPRGHYEAYLTLLHSSLEGAPFLDLSRLLRADEFLDGVHATYQGARRVTERVIAFVKASEDQERNRGIVVAGISTAVRDAKGRER